MEWRPKPIEECNPRCEDSNSIWQNRGLQPPGRWMELYIPAPAKTLADPHPHRNVSTSFGSGPVTPISLCCPSADRHAAVCTLASADRNVLLYDPGSLDLPNYRTNIWIIPIMKGVSRVPPPTPIIPPYTRESAARVVRAAEDGWPGRAYRQSRIESAGENFSGRTEHIFSIAPCNCAS